MEMTTQSQTTHDGVPCSIEDEESHRSEDMVKISRDDGMTGWVFAEDVSGVSA